jgi:DNA-binding SARP family transcriptional activator/tetratricopeptide (TPR) repeat protein/DNA-binding XRE family transcriptional regulator
MDGTDCSGGLLSAKVRAYRNDSGLTQTELAGRSGISVGTVRDLEQGRTRRPRPAVLAALADTLCLGSAQVAELMRAATAQGIRLQVLGPLAAWRDGMQVTLGGPGQRAVLGLLATAPNSLVHRATIIDALWPDTPPAGAVSVVQGHVSKLRRALGARTAGERGVLVATSGASYRLEVDASQLDLLAARKLLAAAHAAGSRRDDETACGLYQQALDLWQGEPLADIDLLRGHPAVGGLARERTEIVIEFAKAAAAVGWHARVLPALWDACVRESLNEQAHAQLMIALAGSGRQAEALSVYRDLARRLDQELAVRPGHDLSEAHHLVLRQQVRTAKPVGGRPGRPNSPSSQLVIPRQLPAAPVLFTGRSAELSALRRLLVAARDSVVVAAIGGTAGVGKTALAMYWARQVAAYFPDGQLYANLRGFDASSAPVDPADAIRQFLDALGVPAEHIPVGLEAQAGLYRTVVAGRRMLIVLDNVLHEDQVRPLLPGSPGCLVLATSRARLAGLSVREGAQLLTLDVMSAEEARELLTARLGAPRAGSEPEALDELVAFCARLPLALAVAAARVADCPEYPLAALAAELREAASRLDVLDTGDTACSIRAVFSWSYRQLRPETAQMFRLLGTHPGRDVTAGAAASLLGEDSAVVHDMLRELTRHHLIGEPRPGRYVFHDLLRSYATEQASAADSEAARRAAMHRMLDYYLHSAHLAAQHLGPQRQPIAMGAPVAGVRPERLDSQQQALNWFEAEYRVLLALVSLSAEAGFDRHAWQLAWAMTEFLDRRGYWHEWAAVQRIALAATVRLRETTAQAATRRLLARACTRLGDYETAAANLTEALYLYRQIGDHAGEARAHQNASVVCEKQNRYPEALGHAESAIRLFRAAGNLEGQAAAINDIGWYHALLGNYREAQMYCEQALDLHRELGSEYGKARSWHSLGYAEHHLRNFAQATHCFEQALRIARELGSRYFEAEALADLGVTYDDAGEHQQAGVAWQQALLILDDLRHPDADKVRAKLGRLGLAS